MNSKNKIIKLIHLLKSIIYSNNKFKMINAFSFFQQEHDLKVLFQI